MSCLTALQLHCCGSDTSRSRSSAKQVYDPYNLVTNRLMPLILPLLKTCRSCMHDRLSRSQNMHAPPLYSKSISPRAFQQALRTHHKAWVSAINVICMHHHHHHHHHHHQCSRASDFTALTTAQTERRKHLTIHRSRLILCSLARVPRQNRKRQSTNAMLENHDSQAASNPLRDIQVTVHRRTLDSALRMDPCSKPEIILTA